MTISKPVQCSKNMLFILADSVSLRKQFSLKACISSESVTWSFIKKCFKTHCSYVLFGHCEYWTHCAVILLNQSMLCNCFSVGALIFTVIVISVAVWLVGWTTNLVIDPISRLVTAEIATSNGSLVIT